MLTNAYYHKAQNEAEADGKVKSSADILTGNKVTGHLMSALGSESCWNSSWEKQQRQPSPMSTKFQCKAVEWQTDDKNDIIAHTIKNFLRWLIRNKLTLNWTIKKRNYSQVNKKNKANKTSASCLTVWTLENKHTLCVETNQIKIHVKHSGDLRHSYATSVNTVMSWVTQKLRHSEKRQQIR